MKELLPYLLDWTERGHEFAVATVIQTWGSSPRPVGSTMLVSKDMEMAGSVSGGCVEGAVIREAIPLIEAGAAKRLAFDPRPEEQAAWALLREKLENNQPCILVSRLEDGQGHHTVLLPDGSAAGQPVAEGLKAEALRAYRERKSQSVEWEGQQFFLQVFPSRSQLLIIGAAHITADLIQLGHLYDFETIVIDPRGVFAHKSKFPQAPDQLIDQYPAEVLNDFTLDAYTYAVVLSHDPKIDDNALHILLPSDIAYIGALGSKKTHAKRVKRLQEAGFSDEAIGRIHAPIGLDINAKTPKEIALAIMGEIIKVKNAYL